MRNKKGFTLIELLVVIGIIGILSAIVFVNSGRNPDRDVRQEAERLKTFFRSVQNKTLSADRVSGLTGKLCGYGVRRINNAQLQVYYVQTTSLNSSDDCSSYSYVNNAGTDLSSEETFNFRDGVAISSGFGDSDKLFFLIPRGETYLNGSRTVGFPISISLVKEGFVVSGIVNIDASGRIY
jgi:prepilin-type N-terminal cleavage/methylation domain-containing protein